MGPTLSDDQVYGVQAVPIASSAYFQAKYMVQTGHTSSGPSSVHAVQVACTLSK
jgi:hypothetical protein